MLRTVILILATAISSCAATPPIDSTDGWIALGQSARFGKTVVTPQGIVEDSRCPADVQCIWAGRVVLRADVRKDAEPARSVDLVSGEAARIPGGIVTLAEIRPQAVRGDIAPADYRFRLTFAPDIAGD